MFKLTKITILIPTLLPNLLVLTKITSLFGKTGWNFSYKAQIPNFIENGPYIPTTLVMAIPDTAAILERTIVNNVTQWTDEDKRLVNIDTKAR